MQNIIQTDRATDTIKQPRDYGFDNIRAILIACVVIGHLLEESTLFRGHRFIYQTIYSFHMPVFIFLTGYFARYNVKKILFSWVAPFLVFQVLYITAERIMGFQTLYQFSTPYWHLWFLLACVFYQLLIPLYDTASVPRQIVSLICVTILSLAIGFDKTVGYDMTLSRFFVFQPWFLLGYYCRKHSAHQWNVATVGRKVLCAGVGLALLCATVFAIYICKWPNETFYGACAYEQLPTDLIGRLAVSCASLVWVGFFVIVLRPLMKRKLPLITALGQNTFPVYILHALAIKGVSSVFPTLLSSLFS